MGDDGSSIPQIVESSVSSLSSLSNFTNHDFHFLSNEEKFIASVFLKKLEPRAILLPGAGNAASGSGAKVVSALYIKKQIIAYGNNSKKSNPFQAKYGKNDKAIFFHAETNVIKKVLDQIGYEELISASDTTLFILRVKNVPNIPGKFIWGIAKPCKGCTRAIVDMKIKRVVFSLDPEINNIDEKKWEIWKLKK